MHKHTSHLMGLLITVAITLSLNSSALAQNIQFQNQPCPFMIFSPEVEGKTVSCGLLEVPESHDSPDGVMLQLMVAIIHSSNPNPPDDPIIYLEGGPGGSALAGIDFWYTSGLRSNRDIILLDQRGTGYSSPSLNCAEFDDENSFDPVQECRDRLIAEGVNLTAYNSRESAADVNALLIALDIKQANLFGISYGTRLALTIMRDYPERIRSALIDGVFPPHVNGYDEQIVNARTAFEQLFTNCETDVRCNTSYPNLRQIFYDTVDQLNAQPLYIENDGYGYEYDLTGYDLGNQVFQLLYDGAAVEYLPALIYEVHEGYSDLLIYGPEGYYTTDEYPLDDLSDDEYDAILMAYLGMDDMDAFYDYILDLSDEAYYALEDAAFGYIDDDSEGLFSSVECYEEIPFNSIEAAKSLSIKIPPQIYDMMLEGIALEFESCAIWNIPAAAAYENEPVISSIPTLLFSGEYDPITPPIWGEAAANYLKNSTHFVFPATGHGATDTHDCPTSIAIAFFDDPNAPPDGTCIHDMPQTIWYP